MGVRTDESRRGDEKQAWHGNGFLQKGRTFFPGSHLRKTDHLECRFNHMFVSHSIGESRSIVVDPGTFSCVQCQGKRFGSFAVIMV